MSYIGLILYTWFNNSALKLQTYMSTWEEGKVEKKVKANANELYSGPPLGFSWQRQWADKNNWIRRGNWIKFKAVEDLGTIF